MGRSAGLPRRLRPRGIGAIVLDVRMPGIGGLAVLEQLRAQGVDQPVIMLTGHGTVEMCRRAFKAGAAEFLEKPVDDELLLEALQHAVRTHVQSRERAGRPTARRASASRGCPSASARCWPGRRRPDQQGDRARAGAVAAHGGDAPREPVRQAGGRVAGAADPALRGAGGRGRPALRRSTEAARVGVRMARAGALSYSASTAGTRPQLPPENRHEHRLKPRRSPP